MDKIVQFLQGIHLNDNQEWFFKNRTSYVDAFNKNSMYIKQLGQLIGRYDTTIKYLRLADCSHALTHHDKKESVEREYNDFIGGFFARGGKDSGYAGYYYQISPDPSNSGGSLLAVGLFNPSREVLDWFRADAMKNGSKIMELIKATGFELLERDRFVRIPKGMTIEPEYRDLLLQRHLILVKRVDIEWFYDERWVERTARTFRRCKPFVDYINNLIDEHKSEEVLNQE